MITVYTEYSHWYSYLLNRVVLFCFVWSL